MSPRIAFALVALLAAACDDPSPDLDEAAALTNDERPELADMIREGDARLLESLASVDPEAHVEQLDGHDVVHLGEARFTAPRDASPALGPSALPVEAMSRDELARAFQAVSLVDGEVYRAAEPNYALADAVLELREREPALIAAKRLADADSITLDEPDATTAKSIVGSDSRFRVTATQDPYWRRTAYYGGPFTCTGFMIGPRTGLTAAHCVWDRDTNSWIHGGTVWNPGNDAGNAGPWQQVWNWGDYYPTIAQAWIDVGGVEWDLAIINFSGDVGNDTGWFGIDASPGLTNHWIGQSGYPAAPPFGGPYGAMYGSWEYNTAATPTVSLQTGTIRFANDTTGGHSGGPVFSWNTNRAFGVVTNHGLPENPWNWGSRINTSWLSMIDQWSQYDPQYWWGSNALLE